MLQRRWWEYLYTTDRVRVGRELGEEIFSHLEALIKTIDKSAKLSRDVMEMTKVGLLIKLILNLRKDVGCDGCETHQSGQEAHMAAEDASKIVKNQ